MTAAGIYGVRYCDELGAASYALIFAAQLGAFIFGRPDRISRAPRVVVGVALLVPVVTLIPALAWAWDRPFFDLGDMIRYHGLANAAGHVGLGLAGLAWGRPRAHAPMRRSRGRGPLPSRPEGVQVFTFHLARTTVATTAKALLRPPTADTVPGLRHAECMAVMALGAPIVSPRRMQLRHLAIFASWDSERAVDSFLADTDLGRALATGWHVRLGFLRRWGQISALDDLPPSDGESDPNAPVVAVTVARLKPFEVPRFIRWGRPVEVLVRDHPGVTLALAAMRPPGTVSTFSVWRSQREMLEMVRGEGAVPGAERHAVAMAERDRRDFHHEFTTLRFRPLSEHGRWRGRSDWVPGASRADLA